MTNVLKELVELTERCTPEADSQLREKMQKVAEYEKHPDFDMKDVLGCMDAICHNAAVYLRIVKAARNAIPALKALLEQKPVAWQINRPAYEGGKEIVFTEPALKGYSITPLYASPTPHGLVERFWELEARWRKPLPKIEAHVAEVMTEEERANSDGIARILESQKRICADELSALIRRHHES